MIIFLFKYWWLISTYFFWLSHGCWKAQLCLSARKFGNWADALFYPHNFQPTVAFWPWYSLAEDAFPRFGWTRGPFGGWEEQGLPFVLSVCSSAARAVTVGKFQLQPSLCLRWQKSISAMALLICLSKALSHLYLAEWVTFLLTSLITCNAANRDTGLCPLLFWWFAFLFINTRSETSHAVQTLGNSRELKWRPYFRSPNSVLQITQKRDFVHCFSSGFQAFSVLLNMRMGFRESCVPDRFKAASRTRCKQGTSDLSFPWMWV